MKKGYYKISLKVHPDRASDEEREKATSKFQTLGKVYSVLSDKSKRNLYDETGKRKNYNGSNIIIIIIIRFRQMPRIAL